MSVRRGIYACPASAISATKRSNRYCAVLGAGAGLRVVLHAEDRFALDLQALAGAVEQRLVGHGHAGGQAFGIDLEAVVLAGDLDLAGLQVLDRVVGAAMAVMHLAGLRAERQRQHLVAEADAEDRQIEFQHLPDDRHGIGAGRRRIARPVGQEHAVGRVAQNLLGARRRGHDRDPAAERGQAAQDVALGAEIHRDDVAARFGLPAVALAPRPAGLVPAIGLGAGDVLRQVHAFQPRPGAGVVDQVADREIAAGFVAQHGVGRAAVAQPPGQPPCVDAGDRRQAVALQPGVEMLGAAVVGRVGDVGAEHAAQRRRGRRLDILGVGADVADMREGEGDDLGGVGRIGEDFLVAGERRVETQLAQHRPGRAGAAAPEYACRRPGTGRPSPTPVESGPAGSGPAVRAGNPCRRPAAGARGRVGRRGRLHRQPAVFGRIRRKSPYRRAGPAGVR